MTKLLFVDTNIYLDFYRFKNEVKTSFLEHLSAIKNQLIITDQVEMEFKKNRQSAIKEGMVGLKAPQRIEIPRVLQDEDHAKEIEECHDKIKKNIKLLKTQLDDIFNNPLENDRVYHVLQELIEKRQDIDLFRGKKRRRKLRKLAKKRFQLGYPPRKKNDTSMGDAINWEWIIHVAENNEATIWVVSRDGDYGASDNDKGYLNDWLRQEFKERSSFNSDIVLCPKLSVALKAVGIEVTEEEEIEEQRIIEEEKASSNSLAISDSVTLTVIRTCKECGLKFVVQENETVCPKCPDG